MEKEKPSDHKQALNTLEKSSKALIKAKNSLSEMVEPKSIPGRVKRFAVSNVPWLRGRLMETPMATLQASLRSNIIDLHGGIGTIIREGKDVVELNNELSELVKEVKDDPENIEAVEDLREKLMSRAEDSLNLERDPETEQFLESLRKKAEEQNPGVAAKKLVANAEAILQFSTPALQASETLLMSAAGTLEDLHSTYATVYTLRPMLDSMYRTSEDLAKAQRLGIVSDALILGHIELAIDAARFSAEAYKLRSEIASTVNPKRLRDLEARAQRLLLPPPSPNHG